MPQSDGFITDVAGIKVGHFTDTRRPTGCTVVLCEQGAVTGVDVRGSGPGTRETDLLDPINHVEHAHAILLSGGSAFGLDAAGRRHALSGRARHRVRHALCQSADRPGCDPLRSSPWGFENSPGRGVGIPGVSQRAEADLFLKEVWAQEPAQPSGNFNRDFR